MPIDSNPTKIAATAGYGAEVEREGVTSENREDDRPRPRRRARLARSSTRSTTGT